VHKHLNLLTRRPAKLTTSQNMDVEMINRLTGIWTIIYNQSEPIIKTQVFSKLPGYNQEMSQQLKMKWNRLCQQANMSLVLSTSYTNLHAWINHASRVLDDAHAADNHSHQFYGKFVYTATKLLEICLHSYQASWNMFFNWKVTFKATECVT